MKLVALTIAVVLLFGTVAQVGADSPADEKLIFEGIVLKIAPPVPASGGMAFYRLAKYRVERVCRGQYTKSEIVVDHLSLTTKELDAIKVGDRVCISVRPSKKIFARFNEGGIREKSEKVKIFYIGSKVPAPGSPCECEAK